jgi:hypothetical protein
LHSDEGEPDINISGGIQALAQLQRASFDFAIGPEILTYLARLPNIVSLGLSEESFRCISKIQTIADMWHLQGAPSFPALEKIHFQDADDKFVCGLLSIIDSPCLDVLSLVRHPIDESSLMHLITGSDATRAVPHRIL